MKLVLLYFLNTWYNEEINQSEVGYLNDKHRVRFKVIYSGNVIHNKTHSLKVAIAKRLTNILPHILFTDV